MSARDVSLICDRDDAADSSKQEDGRFAAMKEKSRKARKSPGEKEKSAG
jgi:hypothetical protein